MLLNAELRRNVWLDFTAQRMILTPLIIGLIIYVVNSFNKESAGSLAFYMATFFIFLWGTKASSETVIEEVNNGTWDFQRQSTLSSWSMAWGKLIGSTLFSWYGAAICLLFYLYFHVHQPHVMREIIILIVGGLFSQALALLFSLQFLSLARFHQNNKSFRYFFAGALIGLIFTYNVFHVSRQENILWHGYSFPGDIFTFISLVIFLGWSFVGLYRSFCKELQYQKTPWIWVLFTLFCLFYFSGFEFIATKDHILNTISKNFPLFITFVIAVLLTYAALLNDTLSTVRYKKFFLRLSERNFTEASQQLPLWIISYLIAIVTGIFAIKGFTNILSDFNTDKPELFANFSSVTFIFTVMLFMVRDILLAHFFYFSNDPKKAVGTIILYLFLLYYLIPIVLSILKLSHLYPMVLPSYGQNTPLALFSILAQISLIGWLCWRRYSQSN